MPHTTTNLLVHLIFSTKQRCALIKPDFEKDLHAYLGGIIRQIGGTALCINGTRDHVHLLVRVPAYGPGGTTPELSVHLLNRAGQAMNELKAEVSPRTGEQQIDLPLAALPPGEYVLEIKTSDATELVGFRVTG